MLALLSILALGFFLGMRHATDPDHVIAVTTIVARHRRTSQAALIGALWGAGHTLTILAVGGAIILLGWVIPARVGLSMEFSVGLMLILLGAMNLAGIRQWVATELPATSANHSAAEDDHAHAGSLHRWAHVHGPETHTHEFGERPLGWLDTHFGGMSLYQLARPLVVGLVHGLAGSAAVALLVLTTIRDPRWATGYLFVFGVGTVAGMMLITAAISVPIAYTGARSVGISRGIRVVSGAVSLAFGLYIAWQIGFSSGLFSAHPQWTPR